MSRAVLVLASLLGVAGCVQPSFSFMPSRAVAPEQIPVSEAIVAIEPNVGDRRFEELGVVIVVSTTKRKRDKQLRAAASRHGAPAVIDVELVTKVPTFAPFFIPLGWIRIDAATLIRWERD